MTDPGCISTPLEFEKGISRPLFEFQPYLDPISAFPSVTSLQAVVPANPFEIKPPPNNGTTYHLVSHASSISVHSSASRMRDKLGL